MSEHDTDLRLAELLLGLTLLAMAAIHFSIWVFADSPFGDSPYLVDSH